MKGTEKDKDRTREDVLEELFRHAAPRERPPSDVEQEIRGSLHDQWAAMTRRRRVKRRGLLAAAASVALSAIVATVLFDTPQPGSLGTGVAEVLLTRGHSSFNPQGGSPGTRLAEGAVLKTGHEVRTALGGGLALRGPSGISLRCDQNSRARLLSPTRAELLAGRIYVDTNTASGSAAALSFDTPAGLVRHQGTRYMVGVIQGATSLSVREGRVLLDNHDATGGERLIVSTSGEQRREDIEPYGEQWAWTEKLATPYETDGRTVAELLAWVARETGRTVEYQSAEARQLAEETLMHGNIGPEPTKVLELAMETTDLEAEVRDGVIVVRAESAP